MLKTTKEVKKSGLIINFYAEGGVGKTTAIAQAVMEAGDKGVFISCVEDGITPLQQKSDGYVDLTSLNKVEEVIERWSVMRTLPKEIEEGGFTHVALDSFSLMIPVLKEYCFQVYYVNNPTAHGNDMSVEQLRIKANGFGGNDIMQFMKLELDAFYKDLGALRSKGVSFYISSHETIKKQRDVGEELEYDILTMDYPSTKQVHLDRMLFNLSDATLYGKFSHTVFKTQGKNKGIVGGNGDRIFLTEATPAIRAKNRFGMPPEIECSWEVVKKYL